MLPLARWHLSTPGQGEGTGELHISAELPWGESLHPLCPMVSGTDFTKGQRFIVMTEGWA